MIAAAWRSPPFLLPAPLLPTLSLPRGYGIRGAHCEGSDLPLGACICECINQSELRNDVTAIVKAGHNKKNRGVFTSVLQYTQYAIFDNDLKHGLIWLLILHDVLFQMPPRGSRRGTVRVFPRCAAWSKADILLAPCTLMTPGWPCWHHACALLQDRPSACPSLLWLHSLSSGRPEPKNRNLHDYFFIAGATFYPGLEFLESKNQAGK